MYRYVEIILSGMYYVKEIEINPIDVRRYVLP